MRALLICLVASVLISCVDPAESTTVSAVETDVMAMLERFHGETTQDMFSVCVSNPEYVRCCVYDGDVIACCAITTSSGSCWYE